MAVGQKWSKQLGMTLIEALVAAIVLSIGLLGVFQVHVYAKRSSYAATNYSKATMLASDMVDRIRLNPSERDNYIFSNYGASTIQLPTKTCNKPGASINECSPTEMVAWDQYQWDQALSGASERLDGQNIGVADQLVGCVFVVGNDVEVVISWRGLISSSDAAAGASGNAKSCGSTNTNRRQVVLSTVVVDSV